MSDWQVLHVTIPVGRGGIRVHGVNHCDDGAEFVWGIGWHSLMPNNLPRYNFEGAEWDDGTRERFERLCERGAREYERRGCCA